MKKSALLVILLTAAAFSQVLENEATDGRGELYFRNAGVSLRLVGEDSLLVTVGARSEDLQNTVNVFPYEEDKDRGKDSAGFRLFERKVELYLQQRIPVRVDGKGVPLSVVQWKPMGKGREDRLDMTSLYVENLFITFGGRIPKKRSVLEVTANIWVERSDSYNTEIQYSLFQDRQVLRRVWTTREKTVRFPVSADSIKAMLKNPPPRLKVPLPDEEDDGHDH